MDGTPTALKREPRPLCDLTRRSVLEYHDCLRLELPALARLAGSADPGRGCLQELLHSLCDELFQDLSHEEDLLFPAILRCEEAAAAGVEPSIETTATVLNGIPRVRSAHERLISLFRRIREQSSEILQAKLESLDAQFQAHHQFQNDELFPRVLRLIQHALK